jgi:hypothetical protein
MIAASESQQLPQQHKPIEHSEKHSSSPFVIVDDADDATVGTATTINSSCCCIKSPLTARKVLQQGEATSQAKRASRLNIEADAIYPLRSKEINSIMKCYHNATTAHITDPLFSSTISSTSTQIHHSNSSRSNGSQNSDNSPTITAPSSLSSSTFLIVTGPTGSGTTTLIRHVFQNVLFGRQGPDSERNASTTTPIPDGGTNKDGYLISGTFDRLQHPDPYRAYCMALTDFAHQSCPTGTPCNTDHAMGYS